MAAKKKTAAKKTPAASSGKSAPAKSEAVTRAGRQTAAIFIFIAAILFFCIVIIPGGNLWLGMHTLFRGLFGVCSFVIPVAMIYIAVMIALDKPGSTGGKLWQCVFFVILLGSVIHIFVFDINKSNYFSAIGSAFREGIKIKSGGVAGALLGYPVEYLFTDTGAKIIIILLAAASLMLITGTTLISLFRIAGKPVQKARESIESAMIASAERQNERKSRARPVIDIALDDEYPENGEAFPEPDLFPAESREIKSHSLDALQQSAAELEEIAPSKDPIIDISLDDVKDEAASEDSAIELPREDLRATVIRAADAAAAEEKAKKGAGGKSGGFEPLPQFPDEYRIPPLSLLDDAKQADTVSGEQEQRTVSDLLIKTLKEFGINTTLVGVSHGPTVTRYELEPSAGVKISKITGLVDDLALRLATTGVRIEAPIPNKAAVGIEVPNKSGNTVCLKELLSAREFRNSKSPLTVALGKDIGGNIIVADLAKMPHILIAGTTGSGKSVCTNAMIQSILYKSSPKDVRMILIDPKQVEFRIYNGIPHLYTPVVTDPRKAAGALGWSVTEMLKRYQMFAENNVRDIASYNELAAKTDGMEKLPLILIVIDELSDLMMAAANEVEDAIIRLAQMARAAGMHLVIATQRPSVDVITGLIKANIPSRLALTVASSVDSRTILDAAGADRLLGKGDMLFMPVGMSKPIRVQGCFVSNHEVEAVVNFLKDEESDEYDDEVLAEINRQAESIGVKSTSKKADDGLDGEDDNDDMLPQAIECVVEAGAASTSMLQRRLRLGYARAGRLIDMMEKKGIVGPYEGSKSRQVLITRQQLHEMNMMSTDQVLVTAPASPAESSDVPPWEDSDGDDTEA